MYENKRNYCACEEEMTLSVFEVNTFCSDIMLNYQSTQNFKLMVLYQNFDNCNETIF